MATPELPSFDLVVATVDRSDPLERLLDSLERQTHRRFRVLLVDQNEDARLEPVVARRAALDVVHLRSPRGLSRARNAALSHLTAEIVAFPDDDCVYPDDLLEQVGRRFATRPELAGVSGREMSAEGTSPRSWEREAAVLARDNLWNRAISFALFLRGEVVSSVGPFDERLGLGSGEPSSSGEEIDFLVRAIDSGALVEYDPSLVVQHEVKAAGPAALRALGLRDGHTVGYLLRKHRYPARTRARMLIRPVGGTLLSLARLDLARAGFHLATLRGRIAGLRGRSAE